MYPQFDDVYEDLKFEDFDLETKRQEILKPLWYWSAVNISLLALSVALLTLNWLASIALVAVAVWLIVLHQKVKQQRRQQYEAYYRAEIVAPILETICEQYRERRIDLQTNYMANERLFDDVIFASPLYIFNGHTIEGSDFLSGTYHKHLGNDQQAAIYFKSSMLTIYQMIEELEGEQQQDIAALQAFTGTLMQVELPYALSGEHRLVSGVFEASGWRGMVQKQMARWTYKTLVKNDEVLQDMPVVDVTDSVFQERFKLHSDNEQAAAMLFTEQFQQDLLLIMNDYEKHDIRLDLYFTKQHVFVVVYGNRYIAEERMHLALDHKQIRTVYHGAMIHYRLLQTFAQHVLKVPQS